MFFVTSLSGAVLVTLFASQILEPGLRPAGEDSPVRYYAYFAVPGQLGLFAAFLVPLLIDFTWPSVTRYLWPTGTRTCGG